jgi:hypothetical protein
LRLFAAALRYSRVPLEASERESSMTAAVRWRGGAMTSGMALLVWGERVCGDDCGR